MRKAIGLICLLWLAGGCASLLEEYNRDPGPPFDFDGSWVGMRDDRFLLTLVLRQHGDSVTGFIDDSFWNQRSVYGRVRGNSLTLRVENCGNLELSGRMKYDRLTGIWMNGLDEMGGWWVRRH